MFTAGNIASSRGRGGPLVALCAALLLAGIVSGAPFAQESAESDTTRKVITSISIGPDGIIVTGKAQADSPDSVLTIEVGDLDRVREEAARAREEALEELERLRELDIIDYDAEGHDIVRFGEDIRIREDKRIRGSVVAIGGSIIIEGHVVGDVVSVGGNIRVEDGASVAGDAVCVGGSLELYSGSSVRGDAVSVGGKINEEEGAYVAGDTVSVGFIPSIFFKGLSSPFAFRAMDVTGHAIKVLIVLLLAWAAAALMPARVRRMVDYAGSSVWLSALVGLAVVIALPLVLILLVVTLIGIPLAIILPIAFAVASIVAYAVGAGLLGYRFGSRLVSKAPGELSLAQAVLLGVIIVGVVRLVGKLLGLSSPVLWPLSTALGIVGVLAGLFIYLAGLGSLLLTRFGAKPQPAAAPVAPAAPSPSPTAGAGGGAPGTTPGGSPPPEAPPPQV